MNIEFCPNCGSNSYVKSGIIKDRQRFKCKRCSYYFTVNKIGKQIDSYYVNKALQLYLEGLSYREIERILGVSLCEYYKLGKKYNIKRPYSFEYHSTYKILNAVELAKYFSDNKNLIGAGVIVTELGDKFMLIRWERFKE